MFFLDKIFMAKSLASPYKIAMFVKSNSEKLYLQTNLAFHEEYFWEGALSERCQKLEVLNCDALDSSWFWGHEQKKITSIISAGGAISFGVVKKVQKNVKSVLSEVQQFYWMNNLCSQIAEKVSKYLFVGGKRIWIFD